MNSAPTQNMSAYSDYQRCQSCQFSNDQHIEIQDISHHSSNPNFQKSIEKNKNVNTSVINLNYQDLVGDLSNIQNLRETLTNIYAKYIDNFNMGQQLTAQQQEKLVLSCVGITLCNAINEIKHQKMSKKTNNTNQSNQENSSVRKKRQRRKNSEINKPYKCFLRSCQKIYASKTSFLNHFRIKHKICGKTINFSKNHQFKYYLISQQCHEKQHCECKENKIIFANQQRIKRKRRGISKTEMVDETKQIIQTKQNLPIKMIDQQIYEEKIDQAAPKANGC